MKKIKAILDRLKVCPYLVKPLMYICWRKQAEKLLNSFLGIIGFVKTYLLTDSYSLKKQIMKEKLKWLLYEEQLKRNNLVGDISDSIDIAIFLIEVVKGVL